MATPPLAPRVSAETTLATPDDPRWARGVVRPPWAREWAGAGVGLVILAGFGVGAWNAAWAGIDSANPLWMAGASLWAVGSAAFALQASILGGRWLRFRGLALRLDPFPASPGGQVGGSLELPLAQAEPRDCRVRLTCTRVESDGDSVSHRVLWATEGHPRLQRWRAGNQRLSFTFDVPADLPASRPRKVDGCDWHVGVQYRGAGPNLDVAFLVPVLPSLAPRFAQEPSPVTTLGSNSEPHRKVRIHAAAEGLQVELLRGRNVGVGVALGIFGLLFAGSGAGLGIGAFGALRQGGLAMVLGGLTGLMAAMFVLMGALLMLVGLLPIVRRGSLTVRKAHLELGSSERRISVEELRSIDVTPDAQMGRGASGTLSYRFTAVPVRGKPKVLLQGVPGPGASQVVAQRIEEVTGVPTRFVAKELKKPRKSGH
ncbi:MAG: hypothetical protein R3E10_08265 [Gemmatimonadota bacterium]